MVIISTDESVILLRRLIAVKALFSISSKRCASALKMMRAFYCECMQRLLMNKNIQKIIKRVKIGQCYGQI